MTNNLIQHVTINSKSLGILNFALESVTCKVQETIKKFIERDDFELLDMVVSRYNNDAFIVPFNQCISIWD